MPTGEQQQVLRSPVSSLARPVCRRSAPIRTAPWRATKANANANANANAKAKANETGTMRLDAVLFKSALNDLALRPRALTHVQAFLDAGGLPDSRIGTFFFDTLLSAVASHGWDDAVRILLAAGADVHADRENALRMAATNGHLQIVERLLAAGTDVHANGDTALTSSADNGHLPVVEHLLAAGADVHIEKDRALWLASRNGHLPIVECLLSHGADVHALDDAALEVAILKQRRGVVDALFAAGADVTQVIDRMHGLLLWDTLGMLDTMVTAIPDTQRQAVLARVGFMMPSLEALVAAQQRRRDRPNVGSVPK